MSLTIQKLEQAQLRKVAEFSPGDRVRVHFQVVEGTRRRTQVFEGVVIKRQGHGVRETFTVRKQSFGVGVERCFPVHSPKIEKVERMAQGDVRRAKLYYLRERIGKRARVREKVGSVEEEARAKVEAEAMLTAQPEEEQAPAEPEAEVAPTEAEEEVEQAAATEETTEVKEETTEEVVEEKQAPVAEEAPTETPEQTEEEQTPEKSESEVSSDAEGKDEPSAEKGENAKDNEQSESSESNKNETK